MESLAELLQLETCQIMNLNVWKSNFSERGALALGKSLLFNENLIKLDISGNNDLTTKDAILIFRGLAQNKSLFRFFLKTHTHIYIYICLQSQKK